MAQQLFVAEVKFTGGAEVYVLADDLEAAKKLLAGEDLETLCDTGDADFEAKVLEQPVAVDREREWKAERDCQVLGMPAGASRTTVADAVELILEGRQLEAEAERRSHTPGTDEYRAAQEGGVDGVGRQRRIFGGGADAAPAPP